MNLTNPAYMYLLLVALIWVYGWISKKLNNRNPRKGLIPLLEEALALLKGYSGGHSGEFDSAEEFHVALQETISQVELGDKKALLKIYIWFAPTCVWDDFTGKEGNQLGNQIFECLDEPSIKS